MGRNSTLLIGLTLCFAGGCATQADVQGLRRDIYRAKRNIAEVRTSLESVRRDVEVLGGQVERMRHAGRVKAGPSGQADTVGYERMMRLEDRVAKLEMQLESEGRVGVGEPPAGTEQGANRPLARREINVCGAYETDPTAPEEMRGAGKAMNEGNYELAISQYRGFLRSNPTSPWADDAQFCIGDSYFKLRDYSTAIYEFDNVRVKYPSSDKIPMALLKSGYGFVKLGNDRDAKLFFEKLVRDYGSSQEAIKAKSELQSLRAN